MPLYVKDDAVAALADELARARSISKTAAVRLALENELARTTSGPHWLDDLRVIQKRAKDMARPGGLPITKEWRDWLYEDD